MKGKEYFVFSKAKDYAVWSFIGQFSSVKEAEGIMKKERGATETSWLWRKSYKEYKVVLGHEMDVDGSYILPYTKTV